MNCSHYTHKEVSHVGFNSIDNFKNNFRQKLKV